jgi:serine/threonine protein kinase/Tol biopolymer transport system component
MINQTISHYRITGQLGSGGMGVVYEAEDLTLGRRVALKFLPPALSKDQTALDRFLFEARTASALNHPNICTIYAVEKAAAESGDDQFFIAMELLEGESLDRKLASGPLPLDRVLDIAIQLGDALDAAHAKGIIHRDIKPANIFQILRGQVKVLDFGLAKLERREMTMDTIGTTQDLPAPAHLTSPGATVGTVAYMSPEQARGEELDTRTDLFSLGTVLFQMATGRLPFSGATSAVIFHAILELDPPSALQINSALPPKLQEIMEKALEKDRELRYQSAADLRGDLRRLKRDTESGSRTSQTASAVSPTLPGASSSTMPQGPSGSAVIVAAKQHKISVAFVTLVGIVLLAAAAYGVYSLLNRSHAAAFQNIAVSKVTETGKAELAAISPDGKYILHVVSDGGLESLWLRNVPTNSNAQVIPPAEVDYIGLRFSPDGNYLYFVRNEAKNQGLEFLYRTPVLGGTPQRLVTDIDSNVTFSPDGKQLAYVRFNNPDPDKFRLVVRDVESGQEKVLVNGPASEGLYDPAWSPDGKVIACYTLQPGGSLTALVAVDVKTGNQRVFFRSETAVLSRPAWLPDGSGLLALAADQGFDFTRKQIVFLPYTKGTWHRVTRDTNNYSDISLSSDGHTLATVLSEQHQNLFVIPSGGRSEQAKQVSSGANVHHFSWGHDGQFFVDQDLALTLLDPASGAKTALMSETGSLVISPSACPDGHDIVFALAFHGGQPTQNIWRTDSSGGNLKQLSDGKDDGSPVCSPDSKFVLYHDGNDRLWKVPVEGGTPQKLSDLEIVSAYGISPDGKAAAFATLQHLGEHQEKLALVDTATGQTTKLVDFQQPNSGAVRFSTDGKAVVYPIRVRGVDNLWSQPLDGSPGKQITDFKAEHIYDFHWSFDGSRLALIQGHTDADVVLIRDAQQ